MDRVLVFVYGTLKTGQPNHHLMMTEETGKAELVAPAVTGQRLPLVIASRPVCIIRVTTRDRLFMQYVY